MQLKPDRAQGRRAKVGVGEQGELWWGVGPQELQQGLRQARGPKGKSPF